MAIVVAVGTGAYLYFGTSKSPTVIFNGQRVARISFPGCPDTGSCTGAIRVGDSLWGWWQSQPQPEYRGGPVVAAGKDPEGTWTVAHLIAPLSGRSYEAVAVSEGKSWTLAFSPGAPIPALAYQRSICMVTINAPHSSCVTRFGFAPSS